MDGRFLWPDREAVQAVGSILDLPVRGTEQDWEIEMADPSRLGEMMAAYRDRSLNLECRSALALLILHSTNGVARPGRGELVNLKSMLATDKAVLDRMRDYWSYFQPSRRIAWLLAPS